GILSLMGFGGLAVRHAPVVWRTWWVGDMGRSLLVASAIIVLFEVPWARLRSRSAADTVLLLALLGVTSALVFRFSGPFFYVVLPMLVVLALVCRQLGAALGGLIVALVAIWFTARGHGPFIGGTREGNLVRAETFVTAGTI